MPPYKIDRLRLEMPGGSTLQGRNLASLIASGLAAADGMPEAGDIPNLRVTIHADPGSDPATLARKIVLEIRAALARTM